MRGWWGPRQKWVSRAAVVALLAVLMVASVWSVGQMNGPSIFLPFINNGYEACSSAPQLHSPVEGAQVDTLAPQFDGDVGKDTGGKSVYIEIGLDEKFEQIVRTLAANPGTGSFSAQSLDNLNPGTSYYWRAQLICAQNSSPFSTVQSFTTPSQDNLPPTVNLISPADAAVGISSPLEFKWEPAPGAEEYLVYYRLSGPHGWYIGTTSNPWLIRSLSKGASYEWYVVARSGAGYGKASPIRTFTTTE